MAPVLTLARVQAADPLGVRGDRVVEVEPRDRPRGSGHFVECVRSRAEPRTNGARSLRVVETLEAAERAATRGGLA